MGTWTDERRQQKMKHRQRWTGEVVVPTTLVDAVRALVERSSDRHSVGVQQTLREGRTRLRWSYEARGANRTDVSGLLADISVVSTYLRDLDDGHIYIPARGRVDRLCACGPSTSSCEEAAD